MASSRNFLGEFEQMILLAVLGLGPTAYGPRISEELEAKAGRQVSRGGLYSTLNRLEEKGYLEWRIEPPTDDRGGNPMRAFSVTESGLAEVRRTLRALDSLSAGLDDLLGETGP